MRCIAKYIGSANDLLGTHSDFIRQANRNVCDHVKHKWLTGTRGRGMTVEFQFENEAFYAIYTRDYV